MGQSDFEGLMNQIREWYPEFDWVSDLDLLERAESRFLDLRAIQENHQDLLTPLEVEKVETIPQIQTYLQ